MAVTESDVRDIFDSSASTAAVEFAIDAATDIGETRLNENRYKRNEGHYDRILTLLACHVLTVVDPTVDEETVADTTFSYESVTGPGLRETRYGRRALVLDHTGALDVEATTTESSVEFLGP